MSYLLEKWDMNTALNVSFSVNSDKREVGGFTKKIELLSEER